MSISKNLRVLDNFMAGSPAYFFPANLEKEKKWKKKNGYRSRELIARKKQEIFPFFCLVGALFYSRLHRDSSL